MGENYEYGERASGLDYDNSVEFGGDAPNFDFNKLHNLGFTNQEISACQNAYNQAFIVKRDGTRVQKSLSVSILCQYFGYDAQTAQRLKYLYDIACGRTSVESKDELKKHLKKVNASRRKVVIGDLQVSSVTSVPLLCLIGGIKDPAFSIYNSVNYPVKERMYRVTHLGTKSVEVTTSRRPEIKVGSSKEVPDVIKVKEVTADRKIVLDINRSFIRLCNRYVILASLKCPEFHLGAVEFVAIDGSSVWVYAQQAVLRENIKYSAARERVLDFGIFPNEIQARVVKQAKMVYGRLGGVVSEWLDATQEYSIVAVEETDGVYGSDESTLAGGDSAEETEQVEVH
jgi:hypothetical protein